MQFMELPVRNTQYLQFKLPSTTNDKPRSQQPESRSQQYHLTSHIHSEAKQRRLENLRPKSGCSEFGVLPHCFCMKGPTNIGVRYQGPKVFS